MWGTFRGASGPIGLTQPGEICSTPRLLLAYAMNSSSEHNDGVSNNESKLSSRSTNTALLTSSTHVVKIASGQDHLVCLTDEGRLYTMGCGEQGQLGRVAERFAKDGGRSGISKENILIYFTSFTVILNCCLENWLVIVSVDSH